MKCIALIPARSGSQRIAHKNIKELSGHPLLAYTICAARDSGIFAAVVCVTDSEEYAGIAKHYGAEIPFLRPLHTATRTSPDFDWVNWAISELAATGRTYDQFSILRPTSPFRTANTIQRAWKHFASDAAAHSLRAVRLCSEHPGKMWEVNGNRMTPLLPNTIDATPWHSNQYAALPRIYVQDASLEIAHTSILDTHHSISGDVVIPFISEGHEGFDINTPDDWMLAEHYVRNNIAALPTVSVEPWKK